MKAPFFIIGFQRSGTTLLRVMLDNHPDIAIPLDVTGLWARYYSKLHKYNYLHSKDDVIKLIKDLLKEERIKLWQTDFSVEEILQYVKGNTYPHVIAAFYKAYTYHKGKKYWGDKDPANMRYIHLINKWFPQSKIIHIIRDGRDACLSHLKQDFGYDNLLLCAEGWREEVFWCRIIGQLLGPSRYFELKFENLIANPEKELVSICNFLNIPYSNQMLYYYKNIEKSIPKCKRHIWKLIDKPPQKENKNLWKIKMSKGELICFEKRAGGLLKELGYETLPGVPSGAYWTEIYNFFKSGSALNRRFKKLLQFFHLQSKKHK